MSWSMVIGHIDVVMRVSEETRAAGSNTFVAILYDELLRKSFAERAAKRDPALDLEAEFVKINKKVLRLAESRLAQVLAASGITSDIGASRRPAVPAEALATSTESVLAKQSAAADALTRKAEQTVRHMSQQQESMERRRSALESDGKPFGFNGGGQGGSNGGQGGGNAAKKDRVRKWWIKPGKGRKGGKGGNKCGKGGNGRSAQL